MGSVDALNPDLFYMNNWTVWRSIRKRSRFSRLWQG